MSEEYLSPEENGGNQKTVIIIVAVVAVLLLCCCLPALLTGAWFLGDPILDALGLL